MRGIFFVCVFAAAIFLVSNANHQSSVPVSTVDSPVETKKPNTDYKPAFAGQTRITRVKTTTPYKTDLIGPKLGRPWAITLLPDGRFIITDKSGFMTIHDANGNQLKKVTDFPEVDAAGQGGMLDVVPDPD